jgi:hypothetical protein
MSNADISTGIAGIVFAFIGVATVMSMVTGTYAHWIFITAGLVVGLMAVRSITG